MANARLVNGIALATFGNILAGTGLFLQKSAILGLEENDRLPTTLRHFKASPQVDEIKSARANQFYSLARKQNSAASSIFSRAKSTRWVFGILCCYLGEAVNFVSLSLASSSVIAALGIVAVVVNLMWGVFVLKEHLGRRALKGLVFVISGVFSVLAASVLSSDAATQQQSPVATFYTNLNSVGGSIGVLLFLSVIVALYVNVVFVDKQRSLLFHVLLAALQGAVTVNLGRLFSLQLAATKSPWSLLANHSFLFLAVQILVLVGAAVGQEYIKQIALSHFPLTSFQPLFFVLFNVTAVFSSILLFNDLQTSEQWIKFLPLFSVGLLLIFRGSVHLSFQASIMSSPPRKKRRSVVN